MSFFNSFFELVNVLFSRLEHFSELEFLVTLCLGKEVFDVLNMTNVSRKSLLGVLNVLSKFADVGSNRGSFVKALSKTY